MLDTETHLQLALWPWWTYADYWKPDDTPEIIDTVERPTEDEALRNILLEAKVIERNGKYLNLNWSHHLVLRLEATCMSDYPHYANPAEWIAERCVFSERQVMALLDEASQIIYVREKLGLPTDLYHEPVIIQVAA